LVSFAQEENIPIDTVQIDYKQWEQNYIEKPDPADSLCISDINRAKKDIENGKIVFTQDYGFLFGDIRYENELRKLCKDYGLVFDFDLISDVIFEGQTQGCYGAYMDKVIAGKFGNDFKDRLHKTADSIYLDNVIKSSKIIQYWDCDERPRLPNEIKRTDDYLPTIIVNNIDIVENKGQYGGWPFFDLGFIVELDSTISGFYIRNFVPELDVNKKYKSELFNIAVKYMNDNYPKWIPGKIDRQIVRTDNNVRIHFRKE
jgi:hypothetical protein